LTPGEIVLELFPAHVFFVRLPFGLAQILKSCGRVPVAEFVILNTTAPWRTVFGTIVNLNSDGLPAVTAIVCTTER
jgi:hypothetical protein